MKEILNNILGELQSLNNKVDNLDEKVSELDGKVSNLETNLGTLNNKVANLETNLGTLNNKVVNLETEVKSGFEGVNKKLDTIYAQVAHNTEQEVKLNEVTAKVESLETDIKLIKKVVTNQ